MNGYLLVYSSKPLSVWTFSSILFDPQQEDSAEDNVEAAAHVYSRDGTYPRKVIALEGVNVLINEMEEKSCFRVSSPFFTYDIGAG